MSIIYKGLKKIFGGGKGDVNKANTATNSTNVGGVPLSRLLCDVRSNETLALRDFNSITTPGMYRVFPGNWKGNENGFDDGPFNLYGHGVLIVFNSYGRIIQWYIADMGITDHKRGMAMRTYFGTWSYWTLIPYSTTSVQV